MTDNDADSDYVCSLTDESLQKAKEELYEDPKERLSAVQTLRKWVQEQAWLKSPTDTIFLLSFLRGRKFSQLAARDVLTHYWTIRTEYPEWFHGLDSGDPDVLELLDKGFMLILPGKDKFGRKILMSRPGYLNPHEIKEKWGNYDIVYRAYSILLGVALMDENVQVNGIVIFGDNCDAGDALGSIFDLSNLKKFLRSWQDALPMRFKAFHHYNLTPFFQAVFTMVRPFLKEKIKNRLHIHGNSMVPIYEHIDKYMLPKEYLPDDYIGPCAGTVKEIIENNKEECQRPEVRAYIRKTNSPEYGVDLKLKPGKDEVPNESFRQLHVD